MTFDSRRLQFAVAGALIVLFTGQSLLSSLKKSPVDDEPPHIAAGLSYLETGVFRANLQHPPLLKEMSALFLKLGGVHWPKTPDAEALIQGTPQGKDAEWPIGNDIIYTNGPDRVLFWARLPFILLAALLGVLLYVWGRALVGPAAALGALFLYALDPTIVAHSFLVTTDVGLAAFGTLFLWSIWRYARKPDWQGMVVCGLSMGAALGAKFSGAFFVPVAAILLLVAVWKTREVGEAAKVGPNSPCPCGSGKKFKKCHGAGRLAKAPMAAGIPWKHLAAFAAMCGIAVVFVEALYFFSRDPLLYWEGLRKVNADHLAGYQRYLHGELATRFPSYFVAAWLLKEPLATIFLTVAGLYVLARSQSIPRLTKLFLLSPPAVFVVAMTVFADDMGVRYLIPAMPFAYLLGGIGLATLFAAARAWVKYAAVGLCLWLAIAAAGIYPDHLSYFNESACLLERPSSIGFDGGSRCGPLWLDDSNVDWGQGLKQLRSWMDRHPDVPPVHLAYPGQFPPVGYAIRFEPMLTHALLPDPSPGWYAVSASLVARVPAAGATMTPGGGAWLRKTEPTAIVGHSFYIYRVR